MAFLQIITDNILPLLVFVAIGYLMDKKYHLDVGSLTKLTFYIILPCFIFYSINIALVFSNPPYGHGTVTPYLAEAAAVSTIVLVQMNMFLNTLGLYQAGKGSLSPHDALMVVAHMPVIYTLTVAFTVKYFGWNISDTLIWPVLVNCSSGFIAIVMMALGMQIHRSTISFSDPASWLACFVRLIVAPLCAWILLRLWAVSGAPFSPVAAQTIFIMSSVPAPVNSVLYAVEFHNHENLATEIVMMTTFLSCITMTGVIFLARVLFPV